MLKSLRLDRKTSFPCSPDRLPHPCWSGLCFDSLRTARCPMTLGMSQRALPIGFIPPCLPTKAPQPPSGSFWLHQIKHDGFRVIARNDGDRVRLYPPSSLTSARWALTPFFLAAGRLRCVLRSLGRGGQGLSDVL